MELIGSGRDGEIFDLGDGNVLRRFRDGRSQESEAALITHLHSLGYPVPEVKSADGPDMIMSLVKGPTMLDDLASHPWRLRTHARTLAELQLRLHMIMAPKWLRHVPGWPGESILHLDFHPANVMLSPDGPVVIDWTNAHQGPAWLDTCYTEVLLRTADVPGNALLRAISSSGRTSFRRAYRRHYGVVESPSRMLAAAANRFLEDSNIRPGERARAEPIAEAGA